MMNFRSFYSTAVVRIAGIGRPQVTAAAGEELDDVFLPVKLHPIAVEFDFVQPPMPTRNLRT